MCYKIVQVNFTIKDEAGFPGVRTLYDFEIPSLELAELLAERLFTDVEDHYNPDHTEPVEGIEFVEAAVEFPVALVNVHDGTVRLFSDQPRTDGSRKPLSDALTAWEALLGYEYLPGDSIPGESLPLPEGHNPHTDPPILVRQSRLQHTAKLVALGTASGLTEAECFDVLFRALDALLEAQLAAANPSPETDETTLSILDRLEQVVNPASTNTGKPVTKPKPHGLKVRGEQH